MYDETIGAWLPFMTVATLLGGLVLLVEPVADWWETNHAKFCSLCGCEMVVERADIGTPEFNRITGKGWQKTKERVHCPRFGERAPLGAPRHDNIYRGRIKDVAVQQAEDCEPTPSPSPH